MPITMELRERGRIFYLVFTDPWLVRDLISIAQQVKVYLDQADHKIHTYADMYSARQVPAGALRIWDIPNWRHPNSGAVAVVGATVVIKAVGQALIRITRYEHMKFMDTPEEAWTFLRQIITAEDASKTANPGDLS